MRRTLAVGALCVAMAPFPLAGQGVVGIVGGLNFAGISGDEPEDVSYGRETGLVVGALAEIALAEDVSLLVQPSYAQRGTRLLVEVTGLDEPVDSGSVDLDYISVPVLVRVMADNRRLFVTSGFDVAFLSSATLKDGSDESDIADRLKGTDLAVNFGFGGIVRRGSPAVSLELRYSQSLSNLSASEESPDLRLPVRFRSSGFQVLAGVLLPLGGPR